MAFPQSPLDAQIELQVGGVWTDITSDVYTERRITIERGRADEGQRTDPGKCSLELNNRSGKYSPKNPLSPYYQLIGRNTPIRVSVKAGSQFLRLPGASGDHASTPHVAALAITGDIDVRIDCQLVNWLDASDALATTQIIGKLGSPTADKAWFLGVRLNRLYLEWSADGTSVLGASSTAELVVPPSGRLAVRATLDVDNGAAGRTITFYTAPSGTSGPWTQLGAPVVQSGTTSIFNATNAAVRIGHATGVSMTHAAGRCMAAEVRNGIAGSVVANPVFTAQTIGASSFADSAGRTWTMNGGTQITNQRTRFVGEVSSWPARWDVSGRDIRVPIEAAGVLRRYGQRVKAFDSTLRRAIESYRPLAYWPMEEGQSASRAYSPIANVAPLTLTYAQWAQADSMAASKPLPVLASSSGNLPVMLGRVPSGSVPTAWSVRWVYRLNTANTTTRTFLRVVTTGSVAEWYIQSSSTGTTVVGRDADGTQLFSQGIVTGTELYGQWVEVDFQVKQNGGNIDWHIGWVYLNSPAAGIDFSVAGTAGRPTAVGSPATGYSSDLDGMAIGHISVWGEANNAAYSGAFDAWSGETAGVRLRRLSREESKPITVFGDTTAEEQVGPQGTETFLDLVEQAAEVDGGILYERRDVLALAYRDRISLYNQPVALALDYTSPGHVAPPLEPVDDDQDVRNDVTVTREGGTSARAVLDTGALSTQAPPNGIGIYDESITLNLANDDQPPQHAAWRLHLGTTDETRYPVLNLNLAAATSLIDSVTDLDSGDRVQISNSPAWLPPGPLDLLMQGYTEVIGHPNDWDFQLNCTPASPWSVAVVEDSTLGRLDTAASQLAAAATSNATALNVLTTSGPVWVTTAGQPAEFPFQVRVGGEVVTVTAASSWLADAFGRTVSNSWGSPDAGPSWNTVGGGSASDYSVGSGFGVQILSTLDTSRRTAVTAVHADFDLYCDITTSALATGDSLYGAATARMQDSSNMYMVRVEFTTANKVIVQLRKIIADVNTQLGPSLTMPFDHVAGQFVRIRFQGTGTGLRVKAWLAGAPEPAIWQIDTTDSSIAAANQIGTRSIRVTGNTNAATVAIRYDNFNVINPQTMTVTRSVNGIVKAQSAGADVRLAQPAIVAL